MPKMKSGDVMRHETMNEAVRPAKGSPHRVSLEDRPEAYKTFRDKKDGCIKMVLKPNSQCPTSSVE